MSRVVNSFVYNIILYKQFVGGVREKVILEKNSSCESREQNQVTFGVWKYFCVDGYLCKGGGRGIGDIR